MIVILDTIPEDPDTEAARQELNKIPRIVIREIILPASFRGHVEFPNISLPCEGHEPPTLAGWGLEGIKRFVQGQLRKLG